MRRCVSGIVPKFLDAQDGRPITLQNKTTLLTHRHIIKGTTGKLPYVSLNEHLCMQVARQVLSAAKTELSADGKALVVHRLDVADDGQPHFGMEDFCALLGLRPAAKYDTTWERIAKAVRDHVPGNHQLETFPPARDPVVVELRCPKSRLPREKHCIAVYPARRRSSGTCV